MTTWPADRALTAGLHARPVLWAIHGWVDPARLPRLSSRDFDIIFDTPPGSTSNRLRTFGHVDGPKGVILVPHYIATRGGTPLHHDPAYPRYSVQLAIYNAGCALQGYDDHPIPIPPGTLYCLDTWSPHRVVRWGPAPMTPTLQPIPRQKLQAVIDYDEPPSPADDYGPILNLIRHHHPTRSI